jgi:hypothetical protein
MGGIASFPGFVGISRMSTRRTVRVAEVLRKELAACMSQSLFPHISARRSTRLCLCRASIPCDKVLRTTLPKANLNDCRFGLRERHGINRAR